jgi:hypothetical protein
MANALDRHRAAHEETLDRWAAERLLTGAPPSRCWTG